MNELGIVAVANKLHWRPSTVLRRMYESQRTLADGGMLTDRQLPLPVGVGADGPLWDADAIAAYSDRYSRQQTPGTVRHRGRPTNGERKSR